MPSVNTQATHLSEMPFPHIQGCPKCDALDLYPCCGSPKSDGHDMGCTNYDPHFSKVETRADKLDKIAELIIREGYLAIRETYRWLPDMPILLRGKTAQGIYRMMIRHISDRLTHYIKEP